MPCCKIITEHQWKIAFIINEQKYKKGTEYADVK